MKKIYLVIGLVCFTASSSYAVTPVENGLFAKLKLDRINGIRILRLPKGDSSARGVTTFVSHNPRYCEAIDKALKKLPTTAPWRIPSLKWDVIRRIVLVNSDGREVPMTIYSNHLNTYMGLYLGRQTFMFNDESHVSAIVSAIKSIERESVVELAKLSPLPIIDAVVTLAPSGGIAGSVAAGAIRVGDRVRINLNELTKEHSPTPALQFSPADGRRSSGWLGFRSAMSCERVNITDTFQDKIDADGYRLMAHGGGSVTRIDVLVRVRKKGDVKYAITITEHRDSFIHGIMRLSGQSASAESLKESTNEAGK